MPYKKQLGYQASHDPLTGLINRSAFETILQDVVKESVMTAGQSVLVYLDLDYFKRVNDTAGHAAGDELLRQLAGVMSSRMRASDIVARLGGDEFGLILRNCSVEYAESFMNGLISEICKFEFRWNEQIFSCWRECRTGAGKRSVFRIQCFAGQCRSSLLCRQTGRPRTGK